MNTFPTSLTTHEGTTYALIQLPTGERRLAISGDISSFSNGSVSSSPLPLFSRKQSDAPSLLFPLTPENAAALRARLPWLNPVPIGTRTSFGFGDRMGSATPGCTPNRSWMTRHGGFFRKGGARRRARTPITGSIRRVAGFAWGVRLHFGQIWTRISFVDRPV